MLWMHHCTHEASASAHIHLNVIIISSSVRNTFLIFHSKLAQTFKHKMDYLFCVMFSMYSNGLQEEEDLEQVNMKMH